MNIAKRMMRSVGTSVSYGSVKLFSLLPLPLTYPVSDAVAWLMHSVLRYRRKVVERNLRESFPDCGDNHLRKICRSYYHWLADYFFETLHMASMSSKEMRRRLTVEGIEPLNASVEAGRTVSLFLGHYCNWEWVSSLPLVISDKAVCGQIYHPLENGVADNVFLRLRGRFGAHSIKMDDTLKCVAGWYRSGRPSVTGYISDQVPGYGSIHLWTDFLNHDTPVFTGAERISRIVHADCYYVSMSRPGRGRYHLKFERITPDASKSEPFSVTREFFHLLERDIKRAPQYWLWSHRRWKRTRKRWLELYGEQEAERRLKRL